MIRTIKQTGPFKKDYKRIRHNSALVSEVHAVVGMLARDEPLDRKYSDHDLHGDWEGCRDCHIRSDCVLIYQKYEDVIKVLKLLRISSHSEVF